MKTPLLLLLVAGCGVLPSVSDAFYHHPRYRRRWHGHGVHGAHPQHIQHLGDRNFREWRAPSQHQQQRRRQRLTQRTSTAHPTNRYQHRQQHVRPDTRALHGGRKGETITVMPDNALVVGIPGFQGERFDVRLDGNAILVRSLSTYRNRGHGYSRRLQMPKNAIKHEITATHLRGSGMEIRIPILVSDSEKSQSESTTKTAAKAKADESIEKVHRKSLAERLNRGWDDPEGVLVEEDYKVSGDARNEDGLLQVIEMDSSISYAKDIDAVSGYIDVRGAWHSY